MLRFNNNVKWLDDLQEYYRERATIEKEYATKLQTLAKKFQDRRTKKSPGLSVGDNPTMTPGSLENASCTTWAKILDNTKMMGDERAAHSEELKMQVAEHIKALSFRCEDYRKRCEIYNTKLSEDRDKTYSDLKHVQKKYFDQCGSVEKERLKSASHNGTGKHNKLLQASMSDMNNNKNSYLLSISASNAHKTKYYHEDVPSLLDLYQDINEIKVQKLNVIWQKATQLEQSCMIRQGGHLGASIEAIGRNQPQLDTLMFIQHNNATFNEPPPFRFEECPIWHDTSDLVVDESAKVFLQNSLAKSRKDLHELNPTVNNKKREIDGLNKLKTAYVQNPAKGNVEEVIMNLLSAMIDVTSLDTRRNKIEAEVATVTRVTGDIDRGMTEHAFKSASFAIPTNCDFCGSTIWGMSRKGYHCQACSYNCHKNCQMKVPANCTQEKGNKRTAEVETITRTDTTNSTADSVYATRGGQTRMASSDSDSDSPAPSSRQNTSTPIHRALAPGPATGFAGGSSSSSSTKVLYAYDAASPSETSISAGESITVLAGDDGSGWIRIKGPRGEGLVPATYVESPVPQPGLSSVGRSISVQSGSTTSVSISLKQNGRQGPAVAPKRSAQKKGRSVRALYDYTATGAGELSLVEGDLLQLTVEDQGDGWATGELDGRTGIFPAAYVGSA